MLFFSRLAVQHNEKCCVGAMYWTDREVVCLCHFVLVVCKGIAADKVYRVSLVTFVDLLEVLFLEVFADLSSRSCGQ